MTMRCLAIGICASVVLLTGCAAVVVTGIGGLIHGVNTLPSPAYPYGARWVKEGMTRQSRLADWVACGGGSDLQDGFRNWIQPEPRESYFPQREVHRKNLWRCMGESGYEYFIQGYEFELPKVSGKPEGCTAQICLYP